MRPRTYLCRRFLLNCFGRKLWTVFRSLTLLFFFLSIMLVYYAPDDNPGPPLLSHDTLPLTVMKELGDFLFSCLSSLKLEREEASEDDPPAPTSRAISGDDLAAGETVNLTELDDYKGCGEWIETCASGCSHDQPGIPRLVHFIKLDSQFSVLHWFAILSAKIVIKPKQVILHIPEGIEIMGCWWERVKKMVQIRIVHADELIGELNGLSVDHFAHKADFLRLTILYSIGGIYMDMDAVAVKPMDSLLLANHVVLSKLYNGQVGNGMMLAAPRSCLVCVFARHSCAEYNGEWDRHSVQVITQLLMSPHDWFPEALVLEHNHGFFPFSWLPEDLNALMVAPARAVNWSIHDNYAVHFYNYAFPQSLHELLSDERWLTNNHSVAATALRRLLNLQLWRTSYLPCAKADQLRLQAPNGENIQ